MHQYIKMIQVYQARNVISFHDRLISLGTTDNIIRFDGKQLLQDVGCTVCFQGPHFHFTETLTTELCFTTQRLLCNKTVGSDRTWRAFYRPPCGAV